MFAWVHLGTSAVQCNLWKVVKFWSCPPIMSVKNDTKCDSYNKQHNCHLLGSTFPVKLLGCGLLLLGRIVSIFEATKRTIMLICQVRGKKQRVHSLNCTCCVIHTVVCCMFRIPSERFLIYSEVL